MTVAQQLATDLLSEEGPKDFLKRHGVSWESCLLLWGYIVSSNDPSATYRKTYPFGAPGAGGFVEITVRRFRHQLKLIWAVRFFGSGPIYRNILTTSPIQTDRKAYQIDTFMHKHKRTELSARELRNLFDVEILAKH